MTRMFAKSEGNQGHGVVIAMPLSFNRKLVQDLADRFMAMRPSQQRADQFRKRYLHPIIAERIAFGITPEAVRIDILKLENAIAERVEDVWEREEDEGQQA